MKKFLITIMTILLFVSQAIGMPGSKVWEAYWNANPEIDLAGYFFYWKADDEEFSNDRRIDCGLSITLTLTGVIPDDVMIAVTAYDASGNEGVFCDPISYDKDTVAPSCIGGFGTRSK